MSTCLMAGLAGSVPHSVWDNKAGLVVESSGWVCEREKETVRQRWSVFLMTVGVKAGKEAKLNFITI